MTTRRRSASAPVIGGLVALTLFGCLASACESAQSTASTGSTSPVSVPRGWKTYTFAKAKISVPGTWTLESPNGCTDASATGLLVLGAPKSLANCPVHADSVVVSSFPRGDPNAIGVCPGIRVNGLTAYVLPCGTSHPKDIVEYLVPALDIEAVGSGSASQDVSGPGTSTVVGRVLHTLR